MDHKCYLFITKTTKNRIRAKTGLSSLCNGNLIFSESRNPELIRQFLLAVELVKGIMNQSTIMQMLPLSKEQIIGQEDKDGILAQYLSLETKDKVVMKDLSIESNQLLLGDNRIMFNSLSHLDQLPNQIQVCTAFNALSTPNSECFLSFAAPMGLLLDCNHIYNQYLFIGDSTENLKRLEKSTKNLQSLSGYGNENLHNSLANQIYLDIAQLEQTRSIKAHFNVMSWTDDPKEQRDIRHKCATAMSSLNCAVRYNTVDTPLFYWAGMPGNSADFPEEETFYTFLEQALCFFAVETNYRDSVSAFGIKLCDRVSGKPVHVDISDLPLEQGIIANRNKFILGPSGSGKSFFTNHLLRQYYKQGAHILLLDTGDSYQGLCSIIHTQTRGEDGIYFTYTPENPLSFNPFYLEGNTYDLAKKESLNALIIALWKRAQDSLTRSEQVAISNAIHGYMQHLQNFDVNPGFNSFYDFLLNQFKGILQENNIREKDFDLQNLLTVLKPYYKGGEFDFLLNATEDLELLHKRFVVFEIDSIKEHEVLFPVVTIILMELYMRKLKTLKGVRKVILIEEAWKAIAKEAMVGFIQYLFKTVRKYFGEAIIVTQEIEDIISSDVVKQAILNNSDCKILLDQRKYVNSFDKIQSLLGLSDKQKAQILSINLDNDTSRKYKEVWIGLSTTHGGVYATEVSPREYYTYTTEDKEKHEINQLLKKNAGDLQNAILKRSEKK